MQTNSLYLATRSKRNNKSPIGFEGDGYLEIAEHTNHKKAYVAETCFVIQPCTDQIKIPLL